MKLPYGISNFAMLVRNQYYFVDKTYYLKYLENADEKYIFFLRPRRFGKSLFVSLLEYYYGKHHQSSFQELFGQYYIGQHPTPLANRYLILRFDFSRIDTSHSESTLAGFLSNVKSGATLFMHHVAYSQEETKQVLAQEAPSEVLKVLFDIYQLKNIQSKVLLLIDEYDHFANELIAFDFSNFNTFVSRSGFVRKFYEAIKTATGIGVVDRLFVTGVSPITLDSLTSGFNIASNLSTQRALNEMMGFTEPEVQALFKTVCQEQYQDAVMEDVRKWYNGYLFHAGAQHRVYNPDMVLYFLKEYQKNQCNQYPDNIIDVNIASDYGKVKRLFNIKNQQQNYRTLEKLIKEGQVSSPLTQQFSFEKDFTQEDFISLLYYLGFITIDRQELGVFIFKVPNYVIEQLFLDYFIQLVSEESQLSVPAIDVGAIVRKLATENDLQPFIQLIEETLQGLSNRDFIQFNEKYIKALFVGFANLANLYYVKSELEVNQKYVDVLFLYRPPYFPRYQFIFEIKYLKKEDKNQLERVKKEAILQLKGYLQSQELHDYINRPEAGMETVRAYVTIFVGDKAAVVEAVDG